MIRLLAVCLVLVLFSAKAVAQKEIVVKQLPEICLSPTEIELYKLINEYRAQKGLPAVKLSASLSFVARTHAKDQSDNFKDGGRCNMHSWSKSATWSSCCYSPDHKRAKCMWDKPRELTNYQADGFEISFYSTYPYSSPEVFARDILNGWKKSPGHNDVIMNKRIWKNMKWQAIGIGINGDYADVWFGAAEDSAGEPGICK
jgi:uncharacterized protein YkwD